MIITMEKDVDISAVEIVARHFAKFGYDVQIKDKSKNGDGRYVVAVLGSGATDTGVEALDGVENCDDSNAYFDDHYPYFEDMMYAFPHMAF